MIKRIISILLMIGILYIANATDVDKAEYSIVPFMAYSNETLLMGGGFFNYQNKLQKQSSIDEISLSSLVIYSSRQQFQVLLMPKYSLNNDKLILMMKLKGRHWPDKFWGIGNNTLDSAEEGYTQEEFQFGLNLEQLIYQKLYLTGQLDYRIENILNKAPSGIMNGDNIIGNSAGNHYLGKGMGLRWKTTTSNFYPTQGVNYNLQYMQYSTAANFFDTNDSYDMFALDLNHYASPVEGWVFAAQSSFAQTENNIPFSFLPELGSRLRAYDSKRFIDKAMITQRLEQRIFPSELGLMQSKGWMQSKFFKRTGLVVFSETGQVAPHVSRFKWDRNHWSNGFGLRYAIIPKEKLNLRMDFGFGKNKFNFIVQGTEAF